MGLIREGKAANGTAIFALEQTKGKGQMGKIWQSDPGENIILSVIAGFEEVNIQHPFLVSAAAALSCYELFSKYAGEETTIKWPNDIFWRDRKAGGILIETVKRNNRLEKAIIGMGINVNQTSFEQLDKKAVSLKQISGKTLDPLLLANDLCILLDKRIKEIEGENQKTLIEEYNRRLFKKNQLVKFKKNQVVFEAKIIGVDKNGELEIERGIVEKHPHGSIEWIL